MSKRQKREYENDEFAAFTRRIMRAYGRRVADGDIAALRGLVELREELDAQIDATVAELRGPKWNYSWSRIGEELGMSKQAAHNRWHKVAPGVRRPGGQPAGLR